jgi:hypothetical protein
MTAADGRPHPDPKVGPLLRATLDRQAHSSEPIAVIAALELAADDEGSESEHPDAVQRSRSFDIATEPLVEQLQSHGISHITPLWISSAISFRATPQQLREVLALPEVQQVELDEQQRILL